MSKQNVSLKTLLDLCYHEQEVSVIVSEYTITSSVEGITNLVSDEFLQMNVLEINIDENTGAMKIWIDDKGVCPDE